METQTEQETKKITDEEAEKLGLFDAEKRKEIVNTAKKKAAATTQSTTYKIVNNGDFGAAGIGYSLFTAGLYLLHQPGQKLAGAFIALAGLFLGGIKHRLPPGTITQLVKGKSIKNLDALVGVSIYVMIGLAVVSYNKEMVNECYICVVVSVFLVFIKQRLPDGPITQWFQQPTVEQFNDLGKKISGTLSRKGK